MSDEIVKKEEFAIDNIDQLAREINFIKDQTAKMLLAASIDIGERLTAAKSLLPHGAWGDWLKNTVDYSQSTANNLMRIYKEYGNSQSLGNLSYSQAVALFSLKEEEREQFALENKVEDMSARELAQAIKEKKELEKKLSEASKIAELERKKREKLETDLSKYQKDNQLQGSKIQQLKEKIEEAKASGKEEEVKNLENLLQASKQEATTLSLRIKQLEKEIKEKPIDVPAVIEKIPEETEKELNRLRKQVSELNDKPALQFKIEFDSLIQGFERLLKSLEAIREEQQEKYKESVRKLMLQMDNSLK